MTSSARDGDDGAPPEPDGARTVDDLVCRLRELRAWAGVSEREVHRRVGRARAARGVPETPAYDTVHRCFRPGRRRLDADLLADVAEALVDGGAARWRAAYARVVGASAGAGVVTVAGAPPDDLPGFTGRAAELEALLAPGADPRVTVVEGMAGVGKTTLAVRAVHLLLRRERYGAVLWVNLHGHAPDLPPAAPEAVLEGFLRRLGMSADRIRLLNGADRAREFRRRTAGLRALVVLDDAGPAAQVAPLLPGEGCRTLVTSRHRLTGLTGAARLPLEVFSPRESLDLLRRTAGAERVDADPATAALIADSVGHLPLALGVVASRVKERFGWTLADHLELLTGHRTRLRCEDSVELALRLSYESLTPDCRRLFRLLACHPGPEVDPWAAAALTGTDRATAATGLATLHAAHLLRQPAPHRYEFHDLVRVYATARAHEQEPAHARRAAFDRLLSYHRHAAARAMDAFAPYERHRRPAPGPGRPELPAPPDRRAAAAWLESELDGLIAAAVAAAERGGTDHPGVLSGLLARYLDTAGHYPEAEALHGLAARDPDPATRAVALARLGAVHWRLGRYPRAAASFGEALTGFRALGDRVGEGWVLGNLGEVLQHQGRYPEARDHYNAALAIARELAAADGGRERLGAHGVLYEPLGRYVKRFVTDAEALAMNREVLAIARTVGDRVSEANVLGSMGSIQRRTGRYPAAMAAIRRALDVVREIGHHSAEVALLNELGTARRVSGGAARAREALECHRLAADRAAELGDRYEQARALEETGHCHRLLAEPGAARAAWRRALELFGELGTPEAAELAARLADDPAPACRPPGEGPAAQETYSQ
ncbi:tetratricopeptide repeat protein [Streptomyces radicis]|uniref:Tetratricopeptide repeat protein n=1 Tax=Streptomyces radicis TaxID=1750517 RepID=A0A3A9W4U4_9ACTN|nr:tetratricopeptide repeat protein [Streptomyces radicis]RKN08168.1 tetratricopeptide repeat protein [Streptomyces radicis]RKN20523.1 tetratricopeptide repeat protein [Streptomyces radicis]